jgi:hypothetical protein
MTEYTKDTKQDKEHEGAQRRNMADLLYKEEVYAIVGAAIEVHPQALWTVD